MNMIAMKAGLAGEYQLVLNEGTDREVRTPWFDNLITDYGLNNLRTNNISRTLYARVGTGTTAAAAGDTTLASHLATSAGNNSVATASTLGSPTYKAALTKAYTFAQGAVVGNITEVGVGTTTTGADLFSRSLIVDASGVPTALAVAAIDQLTVYYRLWVTPQVADVTGTVTLDGVNYGYTARPLSIGSFHTNFAYLLGASSGSSYIHDMYSNDPGLCYSSNATLVAITASYPGGTVASGKASVASSSYTSGSFIQGITLTWGPTVGNAAGGIGAIGLYTNRSGAWQYVFDKPIPKDNTKTLALTFQFAWSRA